VRAATGPRAATLAERLLVVDPSGSWLCDAKVGDLPAFLGPRDLVVLNDAFTWPASLDATTQAGERLELRLAADLDATTYRAIALGEGDRSLPTEDRADPPVLRRGEMLDLARDGGAVEVVEIEPGEPRWLALRFVGPADGVAARILRAGRPIQYAHVRGRLALWDVQTPFAARPMAFEMPSAGRPLALPLLRALRRKGVDIAFVSHAAGLSSTGRASLDARFPLPERFEVPHATAMAVQRARGRGGRVVAVGTTVVRALESAARRAVDGAAIVAARGVTDLRLGPQSRLHVVDAILSGIHEPGASHHDLLQTFAAKEVLDAALALAEREAYLLHEFGDSMLVLPEEPRFVTTKRDSCRVRPCPPMDRPKDPHPGANAPPW
jgi:S-adenosylmethionine:tRNA ribosyltransferase-isomerase